MSAIKFELDEKLPITINGLPCEIKFHDSRMGEINCEISWAYIEDLHKTFVALKKMEVECKRERRKEINSKKR